MTRIKDTIQLDGGQHFRICQTVSSLRSRLPDIVPPPEALAQTTLPFIDFLEGRGGGGGGLEGEPHLALVDVILTRAQLVAALGKKDKAAIEGCLERLRKVRNPIT